MKNIVKLEIENKIINIEEEKAVEIAIKEYFENNKQVKINNKLFDIFNFGNFNYKEKLQMQ